MVVTIFVDVGGGDVDVADLVHLAEVDRPPGGRRAVGTRGHRQLAD